jgi:hypothetical protein
MLLRLLKFIAGLAVGFAVWRGMLPVYRELLAREGAIVRIDRRYRDIEMITRDSVFFVRSATGSFPPVTLPADELTYNTILLFALFAMNDAPISTRNLKHFLIALVIVLALHPLGVLISTEATYALRVPKWSEAHYSGLAMDVWSALETFWRLVGMFGVVFAAWWDPRAFAARSGEKG